MSAWRFSPRLICIIYFIGLRRAKPPLRDRGTPVPPPARDRAGRGEGCPAARDVFEHLFRGGVEALRGRRAPRGPHARQERRPRAAAPQRPHEPSVADAAQRAAEREAPRRRRGPVQGHRPLARLQQVVAPEARERHARADVRRVLLREGVERRADLRDRRVRASTARRSTRARASGSAHASPRRVSAARRNARTTPPASVGSGDAHGPPSSTKPCPSRARCRPSTAVTPSRRRRPFAEETVAYTTNSGRSARVRACAAEAGWT